MLPGPPTHVGGAGRLGIDLADEQLLLAVRGTGQDLAVVVDEQRAPDEGGPTLGSHPVRGEQVAVVLRRSCRCEEARVELDTHGPVGRQRDQIGPLQRADARRLGEAQVIADEDADPHAPDLDHARHVGPGRGEAVDPQVGEMHLPIAEATAVGGEEERGVVDLLALRLQRPADDGDLALHGDRSQALLGHGAGMAGDGQRLFERGEGVAGDGGLGEDGEGRAGLRGIGHGALDPIEVGIDRAQRRIDLAGRDGQRRHRSSMLLGLLGGIGFMSLRYHQAMRLVTGRRRFG